MIRPAAFRGAVFGTAAEGDARVDNAARAVFSEALGIGDDWAFVSQVHGARVVEARRAGHLGEADAIFTTRPGLPVAVGTADCVPIIMEGPGVVAVVHAGWRGLVAGIVSAAMAAVSAAGGRLEAAAIGPCIGSCCYEVGDEVADHFSGYVRRTTWGTTSIDLAAAVADQLAPLEVWISNDCTYTSERLFSYRRDRTTKRQTSVAWLPTA
jgi:YfiH family protein